VAEVAVPQGSRSLADGGKMTSHNFLRAVSSPLGNEIHRARYYCIDFLQSRLQQWRAVGRVGVVDRLELTRSLEQTRVLLTVLLPDGEERMVTGFLVDKELTSYEIPLWKHLENILLEAFR
jgi:hypothetical protein